MVTINVNGLSLCHKASGGVSMATVPDVCKTPTPAGPVPIPYPNIAMSSQLVKGSTTVKVDGGNMAAIMGSEFAMSTGDEPGTAGGVASGVFKKEASWISFSFNVKIDGKAACRLTDKMFHNSRNTVNAAGEIQAPVPPPIEKVQKCAACRRELIEEGKNSDDPEVQKAAEDLERLEHDRQHAELSQAVYGEAGEAPPGWNDISNDPDKLGKYGLEPGDLTDDGGDFCARLYEPDPSVLGDSAKPTVAFRGTRFTEGKDWYNNVTQGVGFEPGYYEKAAAIGTNNIGHMPVEMTGHSLGGGLASTAARAGGTPGTTFNSAGLSLGTKLRTPGGGADLNAYQVRGDILTELQQGSTLQNAAVGGGLGAAIGAVGGAIIGGVAGAFAGGVGAIPGALGGAKAGAAALGSFGAKAGALTPWLMPNAVGENIPLSGTGLDPVDRHSMDQVLAGMEKEVEAAESTLEKETGKSCDC